MKLLSTITTAPNSNPQQVHQSMSSERFLVVFQNVYRGFRRPKRYMNSYIETKYTLRSNCRCFRPQINQEQFLRFSQLPRKRTLWLGGVGHINITVSVSSSFYRNIYDIIAIHVHWVLPNVAYII